MQEQTQGLSVWRNLKIALFHLGSGMADVLTTGVWNRVMISDLGFAATPISLLVSLRYFLAPLGVWAGRFSDERALFGYRRMAWIGLGRALMVLSTFVLGLATAQIARTGAASALLWGAIVFALLIFSVGSAVSGSTFLALLYDRSSETQRGRAVGIVWTFLLLGFTVGGIVFGLLLPHDDAPGLDFSPDALQTLFIVAGVLFTGLWVFSMFGEEQRARAAAHLPATPETQTSVWQDLMLVWKSLPMRFFFLYLTLSMFFAFSQDLILEPFAGDVFGMPAQTTNRFSAYWGSTAILGTIVFLFLARKYTFLTNTVMSQMGVGVLVVTFALLAVSSFFTVRAIVTPALVLLGVGLGIWNVGTLGLMMDLSPLGRAGTFLGFWTLSVTFARGFGTAGGGILRDIALQVSGEFSVSYGAAFFIGMVGLLIAAYCLNRVNVQAFKLEHKINATGVFVGAMD